jgi:hypothetical protein
MKNVLLLSVVTLATTIVSAQTNSIGPENKKEVVSEGRYEAKKNVVKLYSKKEKGTVIITSHRSFDVQLYIFDLEGTIMHQSILKSNKRTKVTDLAKGTYTYTIFAKDESIEEGQLIIK